MPAATVPSNLTIRAYNVGFGDCFLLTFHYPEFDRRILIDYGSTAAPRAPARLHARGRQRYPRAVKDVGRRRPSSHAVVATHGIAITSAASQPTETEPARSSRR